MKKAVEVVPRVFDTGEVLRVHTEACEVPRSMTKGSKTLDYAASIYDFRPILLLERFRWDEQGEVLGCLDRILRVTPSEWTYGGAYMFWAQPAEGSGQGEVRYTGEAEDLATRQKQHLHGPRDKGNKLVELSGFFSRHRELSAGVALLVILPRFLPWLWPPHEDQPVLEDGRAKRTGEMLEGLLLRAAINVTGKMPRFNDRNDASPHKHGSDVPRYRSLIKYLLEAPDASMDFTTFKIHQECDGAAAKLKLEAPLRKDVT